MDKEETVTKESNTPVVSERGSTATVPSPTSAVEDAEVIEDSNPGEEIEFVEPPEVIPTPKLALTPVDPSEAVLTPTNNSKKSLVPFKESVVAPEEETEPLVTGATSLTASTTAFYTPAGVWTKGTTSLTATTTINPAITTTVAITPTVVSNTNFPNTGTFIVQIDSELLLVTAVNGTTWTIPLTGRGYQGTTAATHLINAPVTMVQQGPYATVGQPAQINQYNTSLFGKGGF